MRKEIFAIGQFYHIFNRGVDRRKVFLEDYDFSRFFQGMYEFNVIDPIGSLYENSFRKKDKKQSGCPAFNPVWIGQVELSEERKPLVNIVCHCLNPNHYHFILEQVAEKGIEKFMHRQGTGYTKYFNLKYERNGALFQGEYKAVHIDSNEYLLHLSAYINLNDRVHQLGSSASKSSWQEYVDKKGKGFCQKDIVLGQFKNCCEYKKFALDSLEDIKARREIKDYLLE